MSAALLSFERPFDIVTSIKKALEKADAVSTYLKGDLMAPFPETADGPYVDGLAPVRAHVIAKGRKRPLSDSEHRHDIWSLTADVIGHIHGMTATMKEFDDLTEIVMTSLSMHHRSRQDLQSVMALRGGVLEMAMQQGDCTVSASRDGMRRTLRFGISENGYVLMGDETKQED